MTRMITIVCLCTLSLMPIYVYGAQPIEVIKDGIDEGIRILQAPEFKNAKQKPAQQKQLWHIMQQLFDFETFSKRVLASHWKDFSTRQRRIFITSFSEFLGKFYLGKVQEKYIDESVKYEGQQFISRTRALVNILIVWRNHEIPVELRLHQRKGMWKVYDLQVFGISAVENYRVQFHAILTRETPEQVIERLQEKIEQIGKKN